MFRFHRIIQNEIQQMQSCKKRNAFSKFDTHGVQMENNLEYNYVAIEKRSLVRAYGRRYK